MSKAQHAGILQGYIVAVYYSSMLQYIYANYLSLAE